MPWSRFPVVKVTSLINGGFIATGESPWGLGHQGRGRNGLGGLKMRLSQLWNISLAIIATNTCCYMGLQPELMVKYQKSVGH